MQERWSNIAALTTRVKSVFDILVPLLTIASSLLVLRIAIVGWREQSGSGTQEVRGTSVSASGSRLASQKAGTAAAKTTRLPSTPQPLAGAALLGDASSARVAIVEYVDFECSYCAEFARDTWPLIKRDYVDTGNVLRATRTVAQAHRGPSRHAAQSAQCAAEQGRFWQMHDLLFERRGRLADDTGLQLATQLGLDQASFRACMSQRQVDVLAQNVKHARSLGIVGTPTFVIGKITGDQVVTVTHVLEGVRTLRAFQGDLRQSLGFVIPKHVTAKA